MSRVGDGENGSTQRLRRAETGRGGRAFSAAWFRALASGDEKLPIPGETLRLLYTPAWNWWMGERRVQMVVAGIGVA